MRHRLLVASTFLLGSAASVAHAEPVRLHASLGGAGAALGPQSTEFGPGGGALGAVEVPFGRHLGLEGEAGGFLLTTGEAIPGLAPKGVGTLFTGLGGARLRFFGRAPAGPWIATHAGAAVTGNRVRFAFDAELGWDFRVGGGRVDIGPFAGYFHVVQPDGGLLPEDAHLLVAGIAISLGAPRVDASDLDHDGIVDDVDACPTEPGIATDDPRTNGCPKRDLDRDGIVDSEDACPRQAGVRTTNAATNGCPRPDRDGDTVYDDEDACPEVVGARTDDPKTNGCPPDRDHDGIVDAEDACPDLAGVKSEDPTANGCPPASDGARVVGDRIVLDDVINFDTNSSRVRHVSWPVVKKLADVLQANPDIVEVYVEGHTDQTGPADWNQELSVERARAVKALLVFYGVSESRITTHGYGNTRPRSAGTTPDDLRKNRRVEIIITRTKTSPGGVQ